MKLGLFSFSTNTQLILLVFLVIGLNINTLFHEYALDDIVVLTENHFVQKGIKGIPEILTTDYVKGYSTDENILTGVRYRPLSLILFAFEYQFFGMNPFVSHFINILFFILLIFLLYRFLQKHLFRNQHAYLAFLTCLLFVTHPIHTEVIANVKSRDEIITFIFLIVSLIFIVKYIEKSRLWLISIALFCFVLALLTKETAITFIGVIPLILYFFYNQSIKKSILFSIPFVLVFIGYLGLRYLIVGFKHYPVDDITNSPYLYATASEAFATKVFILFKYVWLLVFPHPLTSDYGYNQIPYVDLNSIKFILSLLFLVFIAGYAFFTFKQKSLYSFCILFFFITISVGTNFIIDLGAPMAERMLFQPSLAFCIVLAILFLKGFEKIKVTSTVTIAMILLLFSIKTIARNNDWENNFTLFNSDVKTAPNCSRLNLFLCQQYIIKANSESDIKLRTDYLKKAVYYGEISKKLHPKFAYSYWSLGFAYYHLNDYLKAAALTQQTRILQPKDTVVTNWALKLSDVLYKAGNGFFEQGKMDDAIHYYKKATELNINNVEAWYNLGGSYFSKNDSVNARSAWRKVKALDPNHLLKKEDFLSN